MARQMSVSMTLRAAHEVLEVNGEVVYYKTVSDRDSELMCCVWKIDGIWKSKSQTLRPSLSKCCCCDGGSSRFGWLVVSKGNSRRMRE
jgi:hypothetical protein